MFEFWQGGNLYSQGFSGISGTIATPLPGGGQISIGGSSTDIGSGGQYPPVYAGGPYPAGQYPPGVTPPMYQQQQGGLGALFADPTMLILIVILIVWMTKD